MYLSTLLKQVMAKSCSPSDAYLPRANLLEFLVTSNPEITEQYESRKE